MSDLVLNRLKVVCSSVMWIENEELNFSRNFIETNAQNGVRQNSPTCQQHLYLSTFIQGHNYYGHVMREILTNHDRRALFLEMHDQVATFRRHLTSATHVQNLRRDLKFNS